MFKNKERIEEKKREENMSPCRINYVNSMLTTISTDFYDVLNEIIIIMHKV